MTSSLTPITPKFWDLTPYSLKPKRCPSHTHFWFILNNNQELDYGQVHHDIRWVGSSYGGIKGITRRNRFHCFLVRWVSDLNELLGECLLRQSLAYIFKGCRAIGARKIHRLASSWNTNDCSDLPAFVGKNSWTIREKYKKARFINLSMLLSMPSQIWTWNVLFCPSPVNLLQTRTLSIHRPPLRGYGKRDAKHHFCKDRCWWGWRSCSTMRCTSHAHISVLQGGAESGRVPRCWCEIAEGNGGEARKLSSF